MINFVNRGKCKLNVLFPLQFLEICTVGTPGRVVAHLEAHNMQFTASDDSADRGSLETLVIDEADLMLSFGWVFP